VRPTDENQSSSRRPNLMSSTRRPGGEINILAMLDGQAPGRRVRALPAVFWYGAAGVVACSLLVVLAWLVRGAAPARDTQAAAAAQVALRRGTARPATAAATRGAARDGMSVTVPSMHTAPAEEAPAPATARGAVIVDVAPPSVPPSAFGAATPATPAHAVPGATSRPQPAAASPTPTRATAAAVPPARPQPAYRTVPPQTPLLAHGEPPRQKRAAAASRARAPSATVDMDVALISAILQHVGTGTGNDAADAAGTSACADKSCKPRLPPRQ
jgi:hypothetical protein